MGRTFGAKDKKKRKVRSDRKKKYVQRKGVMVAYRPKRSRDDPIKIWWWKVDPMSIDGYKNWNKNFRGKLHKKVYRPFLRVDIMSPFTEISNKENISNLALQNLGQEGNYLLKMFSHGKNKFHSTNKVVAKVRIVKTRNDDLKAFTTDNFRISRYWFWRGK